MNVEDAMEKHGFRVAASCAGTASYTKWVTHNGKRAYITVTDKSGDALPAGLDDPVLVTIYDLRSGDELEPSREENSLRSYLELFDQQ